MRHIALLRDDLETLDRVAVTNDILKQNRTVFLDPDHQLELTSIAYQGIS